MVAQQTGRYSKYIRPINLSLFINDVELFDESFMKLKGIFHKIKHQEDIEQSDKECIDKTLYTIQQSIGAGLGEYGIDRL